MLTLAHTASQPIDFNKNFIRSPKKTPSDQVQNSPGPLPDQAHDTFRRERSSEEVAAIALINANATMVKLSRGAMG
jgi:hypothetical protein